MRFRVIYADPPWSYDDECNAGQRGAVYQYPCMTDDAIMGMPVDDLAARQSVLFLWATWPKIVTAFDTMACWGFEYKSVGFVWVKVAKKQARAKAAMKAAMKGARRSARDRAIEQAVIDGLAMPQLHWGMGTWTRSNTEICLVGTRGNLKTNSHGIHSVVHAPRGQHSAKPPEIRDKIRRLASAPRVEMFLRGETPPGWWGWGNQATGQRLIDVARLPHATP